MYILAVCLFPFVCVSFGISHFVIRVAQTRKREEERERERGHKLLQTVTHKIVSISLSLSRSHSPEHTISPWSMRQLVFTVQNSIVSTGWCFVFFCSSYCCCCCWCCFFYEILNDEIAHCTRSEWKIMLQGFSYTY